MFVQCWLLMDFAFGPEGGTLVATPGTGLRTRPDSGPTSPLGALQSMTNMSSLRLGFTAFLTVGAGCGSDANTAPAQPSVVAPKAPAALPPEQQRLYQAQLDELARDRPKDAAEFAARFAPKTLSTLPYDPTAVQALDTIQKSALKLNDAELRVLKMNGFVISARQKFPTFFYGYRTIYADHLPLYVSADSILNAVHHSYDSALKGIEQELRTRLQALLKESHQRLAAAAPFSNEVKAEVDEYLCIALRLLGDTSAVPVAGGRLPTVEMLVAKAIEAKGISPVKLFGHTVDLDMSQFTPRGHYADDPALKNYFRAMIWLGRTDIPLVTFDGRSTDKPTPRLVRQGVDAAVLLSRLVEPSMPLWTSIETVLSAFVGESDNLRPNDLPKLRAQFGADDDAGLLAKNDAALLTGILRGGFGIQRISSRILDGGIHQTAPSDRTFLIFGQRFVLDTEALANLVYDRIPGGTKRLMPSGLDVGFAVMGNDRAGVLLRPDLERYPGYAGALADVRTLVEKHEPAFWQGNLYHAWLGALRGLSPTRDTANPTAQGLPSVAGTDAWSRRILNTQLGSWAELRHDTLLYAKQSYTGVPVCEFPDAYVDPYPEFWAGLERYAALGQRIMITLQRPATDPVARHFETLAMATRILREMAEAERAGKPFAPEHMAFINQAIELKSQNVVCATIQVPAGWYPQLFLDKEKTTQADPTIADVHTQPADEGGGRVGKILHVGTGLPRLMVVTADTCNGPRAYVGLASSSFEITTKDFNRLNDEDWAKAVVATLPPAEQSWMSDIVAKP